MFGDPKVVMYDIKHTKKELLSEPLYNKQPFMRKALCLHSAIHATHNA